MATHTIGTGGGDFSTINAWLADIPGTLTEQRIGQCLNEQFTGDTPCVNFGAFTTTSSFDIILETAAGSSFKDVGVRSNPLRYSADGARIYQNANYYEAIRITGPVGHLKIRNLMIQKDGGHEVAVRMNSQSSTLVQLKDMIVESSAVDGVYATIDMRPFLGTVRIDNVVAIRRFSAGTGIIFAQENGSPTPICIVNGCTVVRPSNETPAGTGIFKENGEAHVYSTVIAGFTTDANAGWQTDSDYNATTLSDGGSGLPDPATDHNVYSITYDTALFVQPSDAGGTHDFRTLTSSALENTGLLDATNAPNDISGTARANPPEIGVWELAAAGGPRRLILSTPTG